MIACPTSCALDPDVSETTLVLLWGQMQQSPKLSCQCMGLPQTLAAGPSRLKRDPYALRPAVTGGLPCTECFRGHVAQKRCLSATYVTTVR